MRDLREVRMAKIRKGTEVLDAGGGIKFNGVGGLEVCESRAFVGGVVDGLRYAIHLLSRLTAFEDILTWLGTDESPPPKNKRDERKMPKIGRTVMEEHKMTTMRCCNNGHQILVKIYNVKRHEYSSDGTLIVHSLPNSPPHQQDSKTPSSKPENIFSRTITSIPEPSAINKSTAVRRKRGVEGSTLFP